MLFISCCRISTITEHTVITQTSNQQSEYSVRLLTVVWMENCL